ncbi:hypothetical protein ACFLWY_00980 [Chloroflexota bacterium]
MNKSLCFQVVVIVSLLLLLVLAPLDFPVTAAGAQQWQFKTEDYSPPGTPAQDGKDHSCNKKMSGPSGWPSGPASAVEVLANERAWWYSDVAATEPVSFGEEDWEAEVHVFLDSGSEDNKTVTVKAWKVASNGTATELASGSWTGTVDTTNTHHQITLTHIGSQNIPVGWLIACSVEWSGGTANVKIGYNNTMGQEDDSWCQTPTNDPGYPVPELPTLILLSAGLAAAFIYLTIRKRKTRITQSTYK